MIRSSAVRIGVAGVGSLGFHHARITRELEGVVAAGVFDSDRARMDTVATELGTPAHSSLESLLDASDAVVVAVPTTAHEEVAVAALDRGLSVMIEKPIAPDLAAADRILAAAARTGAMVQIGHVERFNPAIRAAEAFLEQPLFIESHRLAPFSARSTDVAVVLDLMIHDVDLVRSLVGREVNEIRASGIPVLTPMVDIANARLTFEGGAVANLTASRVSLERKRKIRLFQRSGYLSLDLAAGTGEFLRLKGELPSFAPDGEDTRPPTLLDLAGLVERHELKGDGAEPLRAELEAYRDAVIGLAPPTVSGADGRSALELSLKIEEHIRQGHLAAGV